MSETTHTAEAKHSNKTDISTLSLPSATVEYEDVSDSRHYVTVEFDAPHSEVPHIVGQFQKSGYRVLSVSFDRCEIGFVKQIDNE
ncbi:hypothetical protein 7908G4C8_38 [Haloquadratum phage sp.]|nr:hypothetical protein 7908G4C8_38 [Haloquadratum phage sp.]